MTNLECKICTERLLCSYPIKSQKFSGYCLLKMTKYNIRELSKRLEKLMDNINSLKQEYIDFKIIVKILEDLDKKMVDLKKFRERVLDYDEPEQTGEANNV